MKNLNEEISKDKWQLGFLTGLTIGLIFCLILVVSMYILNEC